MKPKKLIRNKVPSVMNMDPTEFEVSKDLNELNQLFELKILEELAEIQRSEFKDIDEFGDLVRVVLDFANINGHDRAEVMIDMINKSDRLGIYDGTILNNLNPNNPSNKIYFKE